jgi:cell division protein FtsW
LSSFKTILKEYFGSKTGAEDITAAAPFRGFGAVGVESFVQKTKGDRVIWAIVILLTIASLLLVYSSTGSLAYRMSKSNESYLFKQFAFIILGMLIIYFAHRINYTLYSRLAKIIFLISVPLLLYTLFFGVQLNAGSRWIKLPVINMTFQTSGKYLVREDYPYDGECVGHR